MKKVISILTLLLLCFPAHSQGESLTNSQTERNEKQIEIYFSQGDYAIDANLGSNRAQLETLKEEVNKLQADTLTTISKIEISSYTSPEGGSSYNKKLSSNRTNAIYDYLVNTISVPNRLITKSDTGIDWDGLYNAVAASDMEYKREVLHIINNVPEETWQRVNPNDRWLTLTDSRNKHLAELKKGNPYRWMYANIFPKLRRGSIVTIYFKVNLPSVIEEPAQVTTVAEEPTQVTTTAEEPVAKTSIVEDSSAESSEEIKPLFAIKTNLLYDAVTALNVELEVPIGERWSIAAEWICPWWTTCGGSSNDWQRGSNRNTFQLLQGNVDVKYWFGNRTNRLAMTGWFAGIGGGYGVYDFERDAAGYQGEFYTIGLSGGYAHTIFKNKLPNGNLRMEYSLGVGYMQSSYDKYEEHVGIDDNWHTLRTESGKLTWFGPTKAKVSLVWMFNRKVNKEN